MCTTYDADEEFENFLCFSAMLSQRTETAIDTLEKIEENDPPEYVNTVVSSIMKPLRDLMEYKIRKYPYTPENLEHIVSICGGKEAAISFLDSQLSLYHDYYDLLPLLISKEAAEKEWNAIESQFNEQKKKLDGINS